MHRWRRRDRDAIKPAGLTKFIHAFSQISHLNIDLLNVRFIIRCESGRDRTVSYFLGIEVHYNKCLTIHIKGETVGFVEIPKYQHFASQILYYFIFCCGKSYRPFLNKSNKYFKRFKEYILNG